MPTALVLCADAGVPTDGPSGASHHLRAVARALDDLGYDTTIGNIQRADHRGAGADAWTGAHVEVGASNRRGWGSLREVVEARDGHRLSRRIRAELGPVDVVWERFSLGCATGSTLGRRHVLEVNAPILQERQRSDRVRWPAWVRRQQRRTLRNAGHVVAVSSFLQTWCLDRGASSAQLLPNGSDLRPRPPVHRSSDGLIVGFHGSLRPWHGLDRLPAIADAMPEATFRIIGEGRAPSHPRIQVLPPCTGADLVAQLCDVDVAILPYARTAPPWFCPLKLQDYRALGVPVVVPELGDLPSLAGPHGCVVSSDDAAQWAAAIRTASQRRPPPQPRPWTDVVREALPGAHGAAQAG